MLLLGGAAVAAYVLFSKARAASTLIFSPGNITGIRMEGSTPIVDLTLRVQNTSSSGFTLESLAGNVTLQESGKEYYIGNVSSFVPTPIFANSSVLVPVQLRLQPLGVVQGLITAFQSGGTKRIIHVDGFANAGFVRAPVVVDFTIGG